MKDTVTVCSFCGRGEGEVAVMIRAATGAAICEVCVGVCVYALAEHHKQGGAADTGTAPETQGESS